MISCEKSFRKKDSLQVVESEVQKLLDKDFIVEIPPENLNHDQPEWYVPLQAVFTPNRTTQVGLVFDASAKGLRGKSLNEHLEKGPSYINRFPNVLMAWHFDKVADTGDVRKTFNQVLIHPKFEAKSLSVEKTLLWRETRPRYSCRSNHYLR